MKPDISNYNNDYSGPSNHLKVLIYHWNNSLINKLTRDGQTNIGIARTDGRTDRQTDGRTDEHYVGTARTDRRTDRRTLAPHGRTDGQSNAFFVFCSCQEHLSTSNHLKVLIYHWNNSLLNELTNDFSVRATNVVKRYIQPGKRPS